MVPLVFAFSAGAYLFSGIVCNLVSQIPEDPERESSPLPPPNEVKLVNMRMLVAWPAWVIKEIMAGDRSQ